MDKLFYDGMEFPVTFFTKAGVLPLHDVKDIVENFKRADAENRRRHEKLEELKKLAGLLNGRPSRSSRVRRVKERLKNCDL